MLDTLASLSQYLSTYGYIAIYIVVFIGGTYLPIPGGIVIIAVGALARGGYFNIYFAFLVALLASVTSDVLPFVLARRFEKNTFFRNYVEKNRYAKKIQTYMRKYPKGTVFVSRFIGFASMPVNILAGLSKIQTRIFLSMDVAANIICVFIYITIGYMVGTAAVQGTRLVDLVGIVLAILAMFYVGVFLFVRSLRD